MCILTVNMFNQSPFSHCGSCCAEGGFPSSVGVPPLYFGAEIFAYLGFQLSLDEGLKEEAQTITLDSELQ